MLINLYPKVLFLLYFSLGISLFSHAQVSGIIVDEQNSEPIFNVTVSLSDNPQGTVTDENGFFYLDITDFPVEITVRILGYRTREITIPERSNDLTIQMRRQEMMGSDITIFADRILISNQKTRPVSVSRINPADLTFSGQTSAPELLKATPGAYVQQTSVGQGTIYVRGRSGRDVLYMFNNLRLNPGFVRAGQNQYFGAIDPFSVSEISVYRGPVSVFYGSDALSGGVHVKPFVPKFADQKKVNGQLQTQTNYLGTNERTANGRINYQNRNLAISGSGTYRQFSFYSMPESSNDDLFFPFGTKINAADFYQFSGQLTGRLRLSNQAQVSFASFYSEIPDAPRLDRMIMGFSRQSNPDATTPRNAFSSNTAPLVLSAHSVTLDWSANKNLFSNARIQFGFHRLRDDREDRDFEIPPEFSVIESQQRPFFTVSDEKITDRNRSDHWQIAIDFITPLSQKSTLSWGTDAGYEQIFSVKKRDGEKFGLSRFPDGSEQYSGGVFTHFDSNVTEELQLEAGARMSFLHSRIPFEGVNTDRGFDFFQDTFYQLTGAIGARWSIHNSIDLTSNISTGFRAPNVADLAELGIRRSDQFQTANIELKPEKSVNYDVGIQINNGSFSLQSAFFYIHYFDKIERVFTGFIVNRNGERLRTGNETSAVDEFVEVQSENAGSMDLLGLEFEADLKLSNQLTTGGVFNYNWGKLNRSNGERETVDRIPPANGLYYLSFKGIQKLTLRPQARFHFAKRSLSPNELSDSRISQNGTSGFINFQFITEYIPSDSISLRFTADNIFDTSYREHASSLDGLTRNYTLSLKYNF